VSQIVSPHWSQAKRREAADETGQLVRLLGIRPGTTVADVGAGSGYHTLRLSPVVGPSGRIIAQDVTPRYLEGLKKTVAERGLSNVEFVLGRFDDPKLPAASAEVVLLVHMYHEVEQPYGFLWNLAPALKPGGRAAVVDLDRPTGAHGTPPALLKCEFEAVGWRQVAFHILEGDIGYLAVFEPPVRRPAPETIKACAAPAAAAPAG
jgi:ubiquinone/menaquinone biosynthesis C-methylase UbiE